MPPVPSHACPPLYALLQSSPPPLGAVSPPPLGAVSPPPLGAVSQRQPRQNSILSKSLRSYGPSPFFATANVVSSVTCSPISPASGQRLYSWVFKTNSGGCSHKRIISKLKLSSSRPFHLQPKCGSGVFPGLRKITTEYTGRWSRR